VSHSLGGGVHCASLIAGRFPPQRLTPARAAWARTAIVVRIAAGLDCKASPRLEPGHNFAAQFRVRTLHTNNQVNPGQGGLRKGPSLYGGLHFSLALLLLFA
jgi:hypothetical protein